MRVMPIVVTVVVLSWSDVAERRKPNFKRREELHGMPFPHWHEELVSFSTWVYWPMLLGAPWIWLMTPLMKKSQGTLLDLSIVVPLAINVAIVYWLFGHVLFE